MDEPQASDSLPTNWRPAIVGAVVTAVFSALFLLTFDRGAKPNPLLFVGAFAVIVVIWVAVFLVMTKMEARRPAAAGPTEPAEFTVTEQSK